jgi:hypothetical protein
MMIVRLSLGQALNYPVEADGDRVRVMATTALICSSTLISQGAEAASILHSSKQWN